MIKAIKLKGSSMSPFFKDGDIVLFEKYNKNKKIDKGDCIIYRYKNQIYLHKIIGIDNEKIFISNDDDLPVHSIKKEDIIGLPVINKIYKGKTGYLISNCLRFIRKCKHFLS